MAELLNQNNRKAAEKLAAQGNEFYQVGRLDDAINYFTDAILLDNTDHRIYSNRSLCYSDERQQQYEKALADANKCLELKPTFVKGYFRKGVALRGLRRFAEAEMAFQQILKFDNNCEEAAAYIREMEIFQLTSFGFNEADAMNLLENYGNASNVIAEVLTRRIRSSATIEKGLAADVANNNNVYNSCENGFDKLRSAPTSSNKGLFQSPGKPKSYSAVIANHANGVTAVRNGMPQSVFAEAKPQQPSTVFAASANNASGKTNSPISEMSTASVTPSRASASSPSPAASPESALTDPKNPLQWPTIWIGNLSSNTTDSLLKQTFGKFGKILSSNLMLDRKCAFVNYSNHKEAGEAMKALQGRSMGDSHNLLLKFPDKALGSSSTVLKKPASSSTVFASTSSQDQAKSNNAQQIQNTRGPLPNGECYFWRTTGCIYGDVCRHKHIPANKGKDKKPWH